MGLRIHRSSIQPFVHFLLAATFARWLHPVISVYTNPFESSPLIPGFNYPLSPPMPPNPPAPPTPTKTSPSPLSAVTQPPPPSTGDGYTNPFEPSPDSGNSYPLSPPAPPNPPAPPTPRTPPSTPLTSPLPPPPPIEDSTQNIPQASLEDILAEKAALLEIKAAFGSHPVFSAALWNETNPNPTANGSTSYGYNESLPCGGSENWNLIICTKNHVTSITLDSNDYATKWNVSWAKGRNPGPISGEIPWTSFLKIPYLNLISLQANSLSGPVISEAIDQLTFLTSLKLVDNELGGNIPEAVTRVPLLTLEVSINKIEGNLPENVGNMTQLEVFRAYSNRLTGPIPEGFGKLPKLHNLDLSQNSLNGTIPESLGNMTRLTNLVLQSNQIDGSIPQTFANSSSLSKLDLSQNKLSSVFPPWFGSLSNLSNADLSDNSLYGPIPASVWNISGLIYFDISKNFLNGSLPLPPADRSPTFLYDTNCFNTTGVTLLLQMRNVSTCSVFYAELYPVPQASSFPVAAIAVPLAVALLCALVALLVRRKRKMERLEHLFGKDLTQNVRAFRLGELKKATADFSQVLGKGGYGTVYRAVLKDGTIVAVKRLDQVSKQGDVEFIREVELLSRLHHRHLVELVGFCAERKERMLVYEFMAMGSLHDHLHGPGAEQAPLSWDSRSKIAIHVALGLEYLHCGADPPLIHRDVKSANILLSGEGYSKVADFGLCKEAPLGTEGATEDIMAPGATAVRGSFGYLDPEYVSTSVLSEKSDVYSFGVVLLELLSGKKSIHEYQPLAYWAEEYLSDKERMTELADPSLKGDFDTDEFVALCEIARTCVREKGVYRPHMRDVAKSLVENFSGSGPLRDTASVMSFSASETSSLQLHSVGGSSGENSSSYQNYSETLHWTPQVSRWYGRSDGPEKRDGTKEESDELV